MSDPLVIAFPDAQKAKMPVASAVDAKQVKLTSKAP